MRDRHENEQDYLLLGGGLQNCLIALLLLNRHPHLRITLVEKEGTLCGNHTWSFHAADVPEDCQGMVRTLVQHAWDRYDVFFQTVKREVRCGYQTILSEHLSDTVSSQMGASSSAALRLNATVVSVDENGATLKDGTRLRSRHVIDARGIKQKNPKKGTGYQKFVGLELSLREPSPYNHPVLMDACVPQEDGYRFFYVLPFARDRVLVEETRFSGNPAIDIAEGRRAVLDYAEENGLEVRAINRSECGVLPMPFTMPESWPASMPIQAGYRGGLFHPATGYSFPIALRFAAHVARTAPESPLGVEWELLIKRHRRQYRFGAFLNRLLFTAVTPRHRHTIFERFYRLPEEVIERFYRMEMGRLDKIRMFVGRPPRGFSIRHLLEGARQ
jgi:lycopene beta-cyclase